MLFHWLLLYFSTQDYVKSLYGICQCYMPWIMTYVQLLLWYIVCYSNYISRSTILNRLLPQADRELVSQGQKAAKLEDSANTIRKLYAVTIGDRSPLEYSKKLGALHLVNSLLRIYFKVSLPPLYIVVFSSLYSWKIWNQERL